MESELRKLKGVADEVEEELDDDQSALDQFDGDEADTASGGAATSAATNGGSDAESQPGLADFGDANGDDESTDEVGDDDSSDSADDDSDTANGSDAESDTDEEIVANAGTDTDDVEIVADQRELESTVARDLSKREGITTRLETLAVGDYVLSDRVAVERKSVADFLDTLTGGDRSMFEQVGDLVRNYSRPIVIVEGDDLYGERNVHPNAIRGALSSLAVDFNASILRTEDESDTAELLATIARREQETRDREVSVHGEKSTKTLAEQQEYVVASIADIGPVTARSLLEEFGTVEAVMTTREDDLLDADGVGAVTAEKIREVVGSEYDGE
jgi:Fanconi anemia group M protein